MDSLLVVAPNWLGDAVMALPAIADLRRAHPGVRVSVAARAAVVPLFGMVDGVSAVMTLESRGGLRGLTTWTADAARLGAGQFDVALLLPNAFRAAWVARRAGIPERWGLATDMRARLLTRAVPKPRGRLHQAAYYQVLVHGLGVETGEAFAAVSVPAAARQAAAALVEARGLPAGTRYVAMAPGAAYGRAKQWLPSRFAELAVRLARDHAVASVLVGSRGDVPACRDVADRVAAVAGGAAVVDLSAATDVPTLAGVLAGARAVVANDSGAMHLAAAVGAPLVAIFGATDEGRTAPLAAGPGGPVPDVVTGRAWCRPCMLRECPIDHRCMRSVTADAVAARLACHVGA